jgi:hypothetical protein
MNSVPTAPWTGRPAEREYTATGELIVRGRCGAFYQPHGAAHWLPYEVPGELERKLFRKPRPRRQPMAITDFDVWSS